LQEFIHVQGICLFLPHTGYTYAGTPPTGLLLFISSLIPVQHMAKNPSLHSGTCDLLCERLIVGVVLVMRFRCCSHHWLLLCMSQALFCTRWIYAQRHAHFRRPRQNTSYSSDYRSRPIRRRLSCRNGLGTAQSWLQVNDLVT